MKNKIKELIIINIIKSKTITDLIQHKETPEEDIEKLLTCRRFIRGFIGELTELTEVDEPKTNVFILQNYINQMIDSKAEYNKKPLRKILNKINKL